MKIILTSAIVTIAALAGNSAFAATPGSTYGGVQYALGNYSEDGFDEVNPTALVGRLGKYINEGFSIEGRLGIGLQDDSITDSFTGIELSLELDTLIGVYGVGHINLNESSSVYGLVGFTRAEATAEAQLFGFSASASGDDSGISYGVGADIGIGNNVSLNIEYTQYLDKSDFDFSALGLGLVFGF